MKLLSKKKYTLGEDIGVNRIKDIIKRELDEEQYKAVVESDGYSLIIAGPGSGKTRTVTYKIAYLISNGIQPSEIALMTFTRAAAREMIERAQNVCKNNLSGMTAGTFHHVCNLILRRYAKELGYESNFTILDSQDSLELIRHARNLLGSQIPKDEKVKLPSPNVLQKIISYSCNTFSDLEESIVKINPKFLRVKDLIEKIWEIYSNEKREQQAMDYDDLLVNTYQLLRTNSFVREREASRYKWVLVDEFQDTNIVQFEIVKLLSSIHRNLFVVGDDSQSIYSFRGARFENVFDFSKIPDSKIFKLQTNYRSTKDIVELVNSIIPSKSFEKKLKAVRRNGSKPVLVKTWDRLQEAGFVYQRIMELVEKGYNYSDIAILYRSHAHSLELQMELMRHNVDFKIFSGLKFTETAHVKDIIAFLKILVNPKDKISWLRILKLFPTIGKTYSSRIADFVVNLVSEGIDPVEALRRFPKNSRVELDKIIDLLDMLYMISDPAEAINHLKEKFYDDYLSLEYPDYVERQMDIERLSEMADVYRSINSFLSELLLSERVDVDNRESKSNSITLTTVHQAKGLEWPVVFLISVNPGDLPNYLAVNEGNIDEEERIFYVAVTRAKDHLYICKQRLGTSFPFRGNNIYIGNQRFDFTNRIPPELIDEWEVE